MDFNRTVVAIHAHPDDTEAWCAGTLKILRDKGFEVVIVTVTAGGMGGIDTNEQDTITMRKLEAEQAADWLDAAYICLDGRDGFLMDTEAIRMEVLRIIRKYQAGVVMTHLPMDYHSDHRTCANIVEAAAMISSLPNAPVQEDPVPVTPLLYHTAPLTLTDPIGAPIPDPHFFVDVTDVMDTKQAMLQCHQSQQKLMRVMHKMDDFFGMVYQGNQDYGKMVGVDYAEVFWQHLGGGFQKNPLIQEVLQERIHILK